MQEHEERELTRLLQDRLPREAAPEALRRSLEARWAPRPAPATWARRATRASLLAAAAMIIALVATLAWRGRTGDDALVTEAVNDHLRVLYSERPVEVEPGIHQVKPWFEGRLDFAPVVAFGGDEDFPLEGGSVAYFVDRKAATFIFKRRLHLVTLFVFRSEGLLWPVGGTESLGSARATLRTSRGFHVLAWRKDDLGYALVSDVDVHDLETLGAKIAGP